MNPYIEHLRKKTAINTTPAPKMQGLAVLSRRRSNKDKVNIVSEAILKKQSYVDLSDLALKVIPGDIFKLVETLEILDLTGNQLDCLHKRIGELKRLKELYLEYNEHIEIPDSFVQLEELKILYWDRDKVSFSETVRAFLDKKKLPST